MATSLRLPPELEADLKQLAKEHERSIHGEMLFALKAYVSQQKSRPDAQFWQDMERHGQRIVRKELSDE